MPFYRRLRDAARSQSPNVRLVVASVNDQDALETYLKANDLVADALAPDAAEARNKVTPTLLLVDESGTIRGAWVGQQTPDAQKGIIMAITKPT
jgi:hypothetical protein